MSPAEASTHRSVRARRRGVTALESLLAVAIVSIAGTALLSALATAVRTSREVALITVARGLADQLLAEVAASPVSLTTAPPRPAAPRSNFSAVEHYDGWSESPPQDRLGRTLGTEGVNGSLMPRPVAMQADSALLAQFRRSVSVEKVSPSGSGWIVTTSDSSFRRIIVRVEFTGDDRPRLLAESSRIVCHVAPAL